MSTFASGSLKLLSCLLLCLLVALFGGWFTEEAYQPFWKMPGWVLPLVWTPLYILMGLSLWLIVSKTDKPRPSLWCYFWFAIQLLLNLVWSPAFFFFQCSLCGALILTALLIVIGITIYNFHKYVPVAAYLLVPYFLWVLFLGIVNYLLLTQPNNLTI